LTYMVEDSKMRALVTHRDLETRLSKLPAVVIRLDVEAREIAYQNTASGNLPAVTGEHLAYVLYTSGSTGKPKGVEIPHSALTNFLLSMQREPGFSATDVLLAVTTLSFDIAGLEIYLPLVSGGTVSIASSADVRDPVRLMDRIVNSRCN